jgi:hypothetical protein
MKLLETVDQHFEIDFVGSKEKTLIACPGSSVEC